MGVKRALRRVPHGLFGAVLGLALQAPVLAGELHVWEPQGQKWLRDPALFMTDGGTYVLSGTRNVVIEYEDVSPDALTAEKGRAYRFRILSPDVGRGLAAAGFVQWGADFFRTRDGTLRMIASLQESTTDDYDTGDPAEMFERELHLFEPEEGAATTAGGFPLAWRMTEDEPFIPDTYNADPFQDADGTLYLTVDERIDARVPAVCMVSYRLDSSRLVLQDRTILLCPGAPVPGRSGADAWDRSRPLPSERRMFGDGAGGLIEGGRMYRAGNGVYYLFYSSGSFRNEKFYGGFLAICAGAQGPCRKTMADNGSDVRQFIRGSSPAYREVGRPAPVVAKDGRLTDIIFHARIRSTAVGGSRGKDAVLRCANFSAGLIDEFLRGGEGCLYDVR